MKRISTSSSAPNFSLSPTRSALWPSGARDPSISSTATAATFRKLLARAGDAAKLGMPIHPHMLRHSTGFKLANDGQDTRAIQHYLGHKNIQHTVLYTQLAPSRFNDFWKD